MGHLSGNDKGISWCRSVTPAVKGEMAQILQDATDKKAGASKRSSDAAANSTGLATSAAAFAASKRSRASLSSGPVVGPGGLVAAFARQGDIGADAKATMALTDMIHSEGLSGDFAQKPKVVAALEAFKATSKNYKTPGRQQVDGPLLDALAGQYDAYAFDQIDQLTEDYGLAGVSDGATVHHISLVNVLAIVLTIVVLLEIVDCSGYMAGGGKKDGTFIAAEMTKNMVKLGTQYFFLVIFDGGSNMQSAGRILMAGNPQLTLVHCALHVVHLIFGQIALIAHVAALIEQRNRGNPRPPLPLVPPFCLLLLKKWGLGFGCINGTGQNCVKLRNGIRQSGFFTSYRNYIIEITVP